MPSPDWTALEDEALAILAAHEAEGPGLAILGFDAAGPRFGHGRGIADLATGRPFGTDTVVRLASNTKHVFSTMVLLHPGLITPEMPLAALLPDLPKAARETLGRVTVAQALDMTGGLADTRECLALHGVPAQQPLSEAETYAYSLTMAGLNFAPGSELSYSNTGYRLLEWALRGRGLCFNAFVAERIAGGMGIGLQAPRIWGDVVAGLAPGYWRGEDGWQPGAQGMPLSAAGNLAGSAEALAAWAGALFAGRHGLEGIWARLAQSGRLGCGRETGYGLGLYALDEGGKRFVGHSGSQAGYKAQFLIDPATGAGLVLTTNREDVAVGALARRILRRGYGLAAPAPRSAEGPAEGLYVAPEGPRWLRIGPASVTHLGASDELFAADGAVVQGGAAGQGVCSPAPTSPIRLQRAADGGLGLVGEIGHAPVVLAPPVAPGPEELARLQGEWRASAFGARLEIEGSTLWQGIGPARQGMALRPLGSGRWLFTRRDLPWSSEICLVQEGPDQISLATARARRVVYRRA